MMSFINSLALLGITFIDAMLIYWQKRGVVQFPPIFVAAPLLLILFGVNFLLFYFNTLHYYKWTLKKKLLAVLTILILLYPGMLILKYIFGGFVSILGFIEPIAQ